MRCRRRSPPGLPAPRATCTCAVRCQHAACRRQGGCCEPAAGLACLVCMPACRTASAGVTPRPPRRRAAPAAADKHYNFGAQALSNIVYSAATMGLRPGYELLHAVGQGVAWQIEEFKPQVGPLEGRPRAGWRVARAARPAQAAHRFGMHLPPQAGALAASLRAPGTTQRCGGHQRPTPPGRLQGLANIVWGLGKMGVKVTHEVRQMVEVLGREMTAQLTHARHKGEAPRSWAGLGWRTACLPARAACQLPRSLQLRVRALLAVPPPAGSVAPQNVSNMLHGLSNLNIAPAVRNPAPIWCLAAPQSAASSRQLFAHACIHAACMLQPPLWAPAACACGRPHRLQPVPCADTAGAAGPLAPPAAGAAERAGALRGRHAAPVWAAGADQHGVELQPDVQAGGGAPAGREREAGQPPGAPCAWLGVDAGQAPAWAGKQAASLACRHYTRPCLGCCRLGSFLPTD